MISKLNNPNAVFMVGEKGLHTLINFLVFSVLARALGPEQFGTFGLVQAVFIVGFHVGLFFSEQTIIKFIAIDTGNVRNLFFKFLVLKFTTTIPVYLLSVLLTGYFYGIEFAELAALYCLIHFVNIEKIYFSYFRAKERGKLVFFARTAIYLPMALAKIYLVINYQSLHVLSTVFLMEAFLLTCVAYKLFDNSTKFVRSELNSHAGTSYQNMDDVEHKPSSLNYRSLIDAAWPIFGSAFLITLYARIDQFMINSMLGTIDLGIYTTAVKVSEASTYLITTLVASRFPELMRQAGSSPSAFLKEIEFLLKLSWIFSLVLLMVMFFLSEHFIVLFFGHEYSSASQPLIILLSSTIFIYHGVICTQYLIAKNMEIFRFYRVLFGLIINLVLNYFLIPIYGINGAAVATVLSQALSTVVFNVFSGKTRELFVLQLKSFLFIKGR